jgi:hypothetical protein
MVLIAYNRAAPKDVEGKFQVNESRIMLAPKIGHGISCTIATK